MTEVAYMDNSHRSLPTPPQHYQELPRPEHMSSHNLSSHSTSATQQQPRGEWLEAGLDKSSDMLRRQLLNAIGDADQEEQKKAQQQQQQQVQQAQQEQQKPTAPLAPSLLAANERLQQQHAQAQMLHTSSPPPMHMGDGRPSSSLSPGSGGEDSKDSKARRELNTSKRAAQNRNAQRAFRARKEEYIKSLEVKVKDYEAIEERNQALDGENAALRQYIMHLQKRLLDHLGEGEVLPEPPVGLNIEGLQISSSRPTLPAIIGTTRLPSLKPEREGNHGVPIGGLPPINVPGEKMVPEQVVGVKRARVEE